MARESGKSTETLLFGKKVPNPVGVASGPAPNFRWLSFFSKLGYGILTYKTMRDRPWLGHQMPNLLNVRGDFERGFVSSEATTGSITNSLGMPTPDPEVWQNDARTMAGIKGDRFFVMSVTATPDAGGEESMLAQFASLAAASKKSGADAVELNLSCPNVLPGEGGETFTDAELSGKVVDAARSGVGTDYPIFVKVGYLDDYAEFVRCTYDERIAYVAINSISGVVRDATGKVLFSDRGGKAGICGAAIRAKALQAVSKLALLRSRGKEFPVIGLGGVLGPNDALALVEAGADAIETASGALLDPTLGLRVNLGLLEARARGP